MEYKQINDRCMVIYKIRTYVVSKHIIYMLQYKNNWYYILFKHPEFIFIEFYNTHSYKDFDKNTNFFDIEYEENFIQLMIDTSKNRDQLNRILITEILKTKIPSLNEK